MTQARRDCVVDGMPPLGLTRRLHSCGAGAALASGETRSGARDPKRQSGRNRGVKTAGVEFDKAHQKSWPGSGTSAWWRALTQ